MLHEIWTQIENHKLYKKIMKVAESNWFTKLIIILLMWAVALIPTWLFVGIWSLVAPVGFWQVFATIIAGVVILGAAQLWFVIFAAIATFGVISLD